MEEKFFSKTKYNSITGCIEWTASRNKLGYGHFGFKNKIQKAHRVAWQISNGIIPQDTLVCHKCDNPSCVNPSHLFLGSNEDNMKDMVSKGRHRTNPARGEEAGNSKLTSDLVREIKDLYLNTRYTQTEVATFYNVSVSTIQFIASGKTWKHI